MVELFLFETDAIGAVTMRWFLCCFWLMASSSVSYYSNYLDTLLLSSDERCIIFSLLYNNYSYSHLSRIDLSIYIAVYFSYREFPMLGVLFDLLSFIF